MLLIRYGFFSIAHPIIECGKLYALLLITDYLRWSLCTSKSNLEKRLTAYFRIHFCCREVCTWYCSWLVRRRARTSSWIWHRNPLILGKHSLIDQYRVSAEDQLCRWLTHLADTLPFGKGRRITRSCPRWVLQKHIDNLFIDTAALTLMINVLC